MHSSKHGIRSNNFYEDSKLNDSIRHHHSNPQRLNNDRRLRNDYSQDIENNMNKLESRQYAIEYNCADLFYQSTCCFKTKFSQEQTLKENFGSRHNQFLRDLDEFNKEIDAINLITSIKDLKHAVIDIYHEIGRLQTQETAEPQIDKNRFKDVTMNKMKTKYSHLDSIRLKSGTNTSNLRRPEENVDFEAVSDKNYVSLLFS